MKLWFYSVLTTENADVVTVDCPKSFIFYYKCPFESIFCSEGYRCHPSTQDWLEANQFESIPRLICRKKINHLWLYIPSQASKILNDDLASCHSLSKPCSSCLGSCAEFHLYALQVFAYWGEGEAGNGYYILLHPGFLA